MEICKIPFGEIPQLAQKDIAYATGHPALRPFYKYDVTLDSFAGVFADKQGAGTDRATLVEVLREQYARLSTSEAVLRNIESLLDAETFTVTTAHQPSLFTGPLYYLYKIVSTIHLARELNARYPAYHVVPVFVNGGEDHDFAEVNHASIFGKTLTWDNDERGSVGLMKTHTLGPVLAELRDILGDSDPAQHIYQLIHEAYTSHEHYGEATNHLVNELFKDYGLVVLNTNHPRLKRLFIPIMREELLEQPSKKLVEETTARLEAAGFSGQAYAREINLFYLRDQLRERIIREEDHYQVVDTGYRFSREEILAELDRHPEHFSPNVVMRPLYQELILPNLAYIGGGGEIAYWLERLTQFAHFGINFPMLVRRNSALFIDKGSSKRMEKLGLTVEDLFLDVEALVKRYVRDNTENELSLADEKKEMEELFERILKKAGEIDKTLLKSTKAEQAKVINSLENLEAKLIRAEKQRHDIAINQIRSLKDKLFPGDGLQERSENFLALYLRYGDELFSLLLENLNPLEPGLVVIQDN